MTSHLFQGKNVMKTIKNIIKICDVCKKKNNNINNNNPKIETKSGL